MEYIMNSNPNALYPNSDWQGTETSLKKATPPFAVTVLTNAAQHMSDRAATYDKPEGERSIEATVAAFTAITGVKLTEEQGWIFMIMLKAVRSQQGDYKLDSYEDGAAYFALAAEAANKERL
jgi:hypothetical protein